MSASGVSASGSSDVWSILQMLRSGSSASSSGTTESGESTSTQSFMPPPPPPPQESSGSSQSTDTGSMAASFSGDIFSLLMAMQQSTAQSSASDNFAASAISAIDTDGDSAISVDELAGFATGNDGTTSDADAIMASLDGDSDGEISKDELKQSFDAYFQSMLQSTLGATSAMAVTA